jgi:hypothetical protein
MKTIRRGRFSDCVRPLRLLEGVESLTHGAMDTRRARGPAKGASEQVFFQHLFELWEANYEDRGAGDQFMHARAGFLGTGRPLRLAFVHEEDFVGEGRRNRKFRRIRMPRPNRY